MSLYKSLLTAGVASAGLLAGLGMPAVAQQAQDVIGKLGNNEGIFVDGKTFDIAPRRSDPARSSSARATSSTWWRAAPTHRRRR